jgi:hypothetical protein
LAEVVEHSNSNEALDTTETGTLAHLSGPDLVRSLSSGLSAQYLQYKIEEGIDPTREVPQLNERVESIYSPEPIGKSREGYPVYLYQEPILAEPRFVVQLPNGRAVFSDREGRINPIPDKDNIVTGAILGGVLGTLVAGPVGGVSGAAAGAIATRFWLKRRGHWHGPRHQ